MRGLEAHGESPKSGALPMSSAPICRLSRVGAAPPHGAPARFSGRGAGGASFTALLLRRKYLLWRCALVCDRLRFTLLPLPRH